MAKKAPSQATVKNEAGIIARKMQMSRVAASLFAFLVVIQIAIMVTQYVKSIGAYGPIPLLAAFGAVFVSIKQNDSNFICI